MHPLTPDLICFACRRQSKLKAFVAVQLQQLHNTLESPIKDWTAAHSVITKHDQLKLKVTALSSASKMPAPDTREPEELEAAANYLQTYMPSGSQPVAEFAAAAEEWKKKLAEWIPAMREGMPPK